MMDMERIDVHCHVVPSGYRQYACDNGHAQPDGMPALPAGSPEEHIALMKKLNITKSILSISSPGTHLTPTKNHQAAKMTRQTNEELSEICARYPSSFAFFASLPLPSIEESIEEIDHALDNLGAVGFAVMSNANGVYLGDATLDPIFERLNSRKATLFIHPTTCHLLSPDGRVEAAKPLAQYARPMMEFLFDETRAVANLLLSALGGMQNASVSFRKLLRERFYFDLAGFPFPDQIHGLLRTLGEGAEERLLYGSDYPFTPGKLVVGLAGQMDEGITEIFRADQVEKVYSGNARALFGL
ncbi:hypothetical protein PG990_010623 [Apiospora arundinis]